MPKEGKGERMWTWREALMIGTLRSLEARMKNSDPEGTCKKVIDAWLADIRLVIKDAEMPDYIAAFDAAYNGRISESSSPGPGGRG